MSVPTLFDQCELPTTGPYMTPPTNGTATSGKAAKKQSQHKTELDRQNILATLRDFGPEIDEDLGYATDLEANSLRPRRYELVKLGFIKATDKVKNTHTGSPATMWAITEEGLAYLSGIGK